MQIKDVVLIIQKDKRLQCWHVDHSYQIIHMNIQDYFNQECLKHGYTHKGAISAIRFHLKIKQMVPILVHPYRKILFFPIPIHDAILWFQYHPSIKVKRIHDYLCELRVFNYSFELAVNVRVIRRQIKRCLTYIDILSVNELEWVCYEKIELPINTLIFDGHDKRKDYT